MNPFEYYRKNNNLTQQQVADILSLDQTTISRWEKGRKLPRAERLTKIAKLYGCSVEDLLPK